MTDRLAYRVPEVCSMLGISRATFYRRVESGDIAVLKLGSITLVKRETLDRLIELMDASPTEVLDGFVYFIDDGFFIKIGFSKHPPDRIIKLQTASPFKLTLIRSFPGNRRMEAELHKKFRHLKSHGEWFRGERELRQFIFAVERAPDATPDLAKDAVLQEEAG